MAVEVDTRRKVVEIVWDIENVHGATVNIQASNGGDVSTRSDLKNDGRATLTFPKDYHGESRVIVKGSGGGCEKGTIKV